MHAVVFTQRGMRELKALPRDIQRRIDRKLRWIAGLPDPLTVAKPLANLPPVTHRFRIGKYRVSFYVAHRTIFVERVELRGQAYGR